MANEKQTETETATEQPGPEVSAEAVQLTLSDMQSLANVIDLASRRGAFQAGEMEAVGTVYNKLNSFLQYIASTQKPAEADAETPAEAE